jgi:hypothetical protein
MKVEKLYISFNFLWKLFPMDFLAINFSNGLKLAQKSFLTPILIFSKKCYLKVILAFLKAKQAHKRCKNKKVSYEVLHLYQQARIGFFLIFIQPCFICRPSDSTVLEGAGIEPRIIKFLKSFF